MSELVLRNRQRVRRVNTHLLRRIVHSFIKDFAGVENYELCVHLVAETEMTKLNKRFLQHAGSTDVITFDYSARQASSLSSLYEFTKTSDRLGGSPILHGEIFVCVNEAVRQARRFRTNWQSELVRYVIHGVLHLRGFDDQPPIARRKMKREETRLLREMTRRFSLKQLASARLARAA